MDNTAIKEKCATDSHASDLQTASYQAVEWSKKNLRKNDSDKSKAMDIAFTSKNHVIPAICPVGEILESVHTFELLGVIISSDMS